jgi:ribose/xylose/arabinose/galactoside ABC-type transport system permease subunit
VLIVVIASVVLQHTRSGRLVYAVGSNPEAAAILGIRSRLVGFIVFALCGMLVLGPPQVFNADNIDQFNF